MMHPQLALQMTLLIPSAFHRRATVDGVAADYEMITALA